MDSGKHYFIARMFIATGILVMLSGGVDPNVTFLIFLVIVRMEYIAYRTRFSIQYFYKQEGLFFKASKLMQEDLLRVKDENLQHSTMITALMKDLKAIEQEHKNRGWRK